MKWKALSVDVRELAVKVFIVHADVELATTKAMISDPAVARGVTVTNGGFVKGFVKFKV